MDNLKFDKYEIKEILGKGKYGTTYKGIDKRLCKEVAIKIETNDSPILFIKREAKIYNKLKNLKCVPKLLWYGLYESQNCIIIEMLGDTITMKIERMIPLNLCNIYVEMISIMERIHSKGIIHRDLKPDNFLFGKEDNNLFLIDFGMSLFYIKNSSHISEYNLNGLVGSMNYASIDVHMRKGLSRKHDLESLGYIFIYMKYRNLPWGNERNEKDVLKVKLEYNHDTMIFKYLNYVRNLEFRDTPNYQKLKDIMCETI